MLVTCEKPYIGVVLVTMGLAFSGFTYGSGFLVNYNDIGGAYAGMVFGISNTIGTVSGIVAPYLVGLLTPNVSHLKNKLNINKLKSNQIFYFEIRKHKMNGKLCFL